MEQVITVQIKLFPTREQAELLTRMSQDYIETINQLVSEMVTENKPTKKTSKHLAVALPSAVKNQAILDAKSVFNKAKKTKFARIPILKKQVCIWNNQNYSIDNRAISMPLFIHGKAKKTSIKAVFTEEHVRQVDLLKHKRGTLRIKKKGEKWMAQIAVTISVNEQASSRKMGVDLGLKVPAVAVTENDKVRFFGNGRQNKYMKRKFRNKRKKLGQKKKLHAIRTLNNKEQRYMINQDHQVSRAIVNFAVENEISVICLERLANIRQTARTSRKNEKNLHTWSFYRLSQFIEYKARLAGIRVEYVNPAYTSQICPACTKRNKAKDRLYTCACGCKKHRDIVGAMNIIHAPVVDGHS